MATAIASRRSVKAPAARTVRYLVVEGEPYRPHSSADHKNRRSPGDLPKGFEMWSSQVIGDFATAEEAIAECIAINTTMLKTGMDDKSWAMVVVKF